MMEVMTSLIFNNALNMPGMAPHSAPPTIAARQATIQLHGAGIGTRKEMTRAKKMLIIVGNRSVVNYMVDNLESKNRKTGLKEKLENLLYLNENKGKKKV